MNIFEGLDLYRKKEMISRLLPDGIDRTTAIVILYALNVDITIMGIDLSEEGIYETGYYAILDRLPFKINELTQEEREVLNDYCMSIVTRNECYHNSKYE